MSGIRAMTGWLDDLPTSVPSALRERMREAITAAEPADSRATQLGNAALVAMRAALAGGDDRAAALDLLAADALFTHAAEAASQEGTDALHAFADRFGSQGLRRVFLTETEG